MRKILLQLIFILTVQVIISCNWKNDEKEVELGNGYSYIPFQEIVFDVSMFGGNGIYIHDNKIKLPVIFPEILNYKFDSIYVIVKQKFDFKETSILLQSLLYNPDVYFGYKENIVLLDQFYKDTIHKEPNSSTKEQFVFSVMKKDSYITKMDVDRTNYYIIQKRQKVSPLLSTSFP